MPALEVDRTSYVYAYGISGRIVYVGKGKGSRAKVHLNRSHNDRLNAAIRKARSDGRSIRVRLIAKDLTDAEASRIEKRAIFKWRDRLCNRSLGARSELEKAHDDAIEMLNNLVSEEWVRQRGPYQGVTVERSLEVHGLIRQFCLEHILDFEAQRRPVQSRPI